MLEAADACTYGLLDRFRSARMGADVGTFCGRGVHGGFNFFECHLRFVERFAPLGNPFANENLDVVGAGMEFLAYGFAELFRPVGGDYPNPAPWPPVVEIPRPAEKMRGPVAQPF